MFLFQNLFRNKKQHCAKGYPDRFPNGREKREQTDKQTKKHFRIYISRDSSLYKHGSTVSSE